MIRSNSKNLHVVCYDEYSYMSNVAELDKHGAMFAYKRNDKKMRLKNLGPIAIVFPRDRFLGELNCNNGMQDAIVFEDRGAK